MLFTNRHRNVQESRKTALAADAETVLRQRALATLHVRQQADDVECILATIFAINPLVRRQEVLQRHSERDPMTPLSDEPHSDVPRPPQCGHKVRGLPAL